MNNNTREILQILQEECAETVQAISKCFRFGMDGSLSDGPTNKERLIAELGDIIAMIELLQKNEEDITEQKIQLAKNIKFEKLKKWSNIEGI